MEFAVTQNRSHHTLFMSSGESSLSLSMVLLRLPLHICIFLSLSVTQSLLGTFKVFLIFPSPNRPPKPLFDVCVFFKSNLFPLGCKEGLLL